MLTNKKLAIIAGHVSILSELARARNADTADTTLITHKGKLQEQDAGSTQANLVRILRQRQVVKIVKVGATMLIWFLASNTLLTLKLSS